MENKSWWRRLTNITLPPTGSLHKLALITRCHLIRVIVIRVKRYQRIAIKNCWSLCASVLVLVCVHCVAAPQLRKTLVRSCGYKFPPDKWYQFNCSCTTPHFQNTHEARVARCRGEEDINNMKQVWSITGGTTEEAEWETALANILREKCSKMVKTQGETKICWIAFYLEFEGPCHLYDVLDKEWTLSNKFCCCPFTLTYEGVEISSPPALVEPDWGLMLCLAPLSTPPSD